MQKNILQHLSTLAQDELFKSDSDLHGLMVDELHRQSNTLALVASCSVADLSVLACEGLFLDNVTAEGYPGARYHAGCRVIDHIERLAVSRACETYGAKYANVQPLSASIANQVVIASLIKPGETLMGMDLDAGGHLSHGSKVNVSGKHFNAIGYGVGQDGLLDFAEIMRLAEKHRPKLIIAGTTAYPRTLDFKEFRRIADAVEAYLLADITHIAGLVAAGEHPSPIDFAHVTTLCTHKQLYGPRGGLILSGTAYDTVVDAELGTTLAQKLDRGVFPLYQGAPAPNKIAAKARALDRAGSENFKKLARGIKFLASCAASTLEKFGAKVQFGGTDNHIVIVDVFSSFGISGIVAQKALEECGIIVNKNRIVNDSKPVTVASGIRIGTNSAAVRGINEAGMMEICQAIFDVMKAVQPLGDREYIFDPETRDSVGKNVRDLCRRFPIPGFEFMHPSADASLVH